MIGSTERRWLGDAQEMGILYFTWVSTNRGAMPASSLLFWLTLARLVFTLAGKNNPTEEKRPGATGSGKKAPPAAQRTPPPLPPPTRPDEQLYWLDLTVDHKWDLRLNKPFDRAVGGEVHAYVRRMLNFADQVNCDRSTSDVGRSKAAFSMRDEPDTETHSQPGDR